MSSKKLEIVGGSLKKVVRFANCRKIVGSPVIRKFSDGRSEIKFSKKKNQEPMRESATKKIRTLCGNPVENFNKDLS